MRETLTGSGSVSSRARPSSIQQARNLPTTNSQPEAGRVTTNSSVPVRRSSLHMRMVSAADRKMSSTGIHSNMGRTSATLRAKNASTQKKTNSVTARKTSRNR